MPIEENSLWNQPVRGNLTAFANAATRFISIDGSGNLQMELNNSQIKNRLRHYYSEIGLEQYFNELKVQQRIR